MPTFAADKLATWTGGTWSPFPRTAITGFNQDTRSLSAGQVFVALKTEKRDGHDFLGEAQAKGAAAALVMSGDKAKALGLKGLAYLRGFATAGVDPAIMGIGPVPAIRKLLSKAGMKIEQIDLIELNEAFASQSVYCQRELGISDEQLNVNGGAIALGHPLGCTGAKLTATLLHELGRRGKKWGIVSMCIGGGQGAAALFERIA